MATASARVRFIRFCTAWSEPAFSGPHLIACKAAGEGSIESLPRENAPSKRPGLKWMNYTTNCTKSTRAGSLVTRVPTRYEHRQFAHAT